jgi:hypothetical protein
VPARKRWVSDALVTMLIGMKKYQSAAEVVSGSNDMFASYSSQIKDTIARTQEIPTGVPFSDLKLVLDTANQEIIDHREWQEEIIASLPKADDEKGLTEPLRQAFSSAAKARNELLQEVMTAHEKYLSAQAGAFKVSE